jgi:hypothetical protein
VERNNRRGQGPEGVVAPEKTKEKEGEEKEKRRRRSCVFDVHVTVHRDKFLIIKPTR